MHGFILQLPQQVFIASTGTTLLSPLPTNWGSRVRFPAGAGNFSLHHRDQTGSEAHPASYPMDTRGSFHGAKQPGREVDYSLPSSAEVKECVELYLHSPNTPSWRGAQFRKSTGTSLPLPMNWFWFAKLTALPHMSEKGQKKFNVSYGWPDVRCFWSQIALKKKCVQFECKQSTCS
jgi:hypothetical protein